MHPVLPLKKISEVKTVKLSLYINRMVVSVVTTTALDPFSPHSVKSVIQVFPDEVILASAVDNTSLFLI